ncbi:MAG: hypothetical protein NZ744_03930 [Pirellulaceae bacterium]|nr:hypothetical protein [Pirellulaceae bacterium]
MPSSTFPKPQLVRPISDESACRGHDPNSSGPWQTPQRRIPNASTALAVQLIATTTKTNEVSP